MDAAGISITYKSFVGAEISAVIEGLAKLRITVFLDYPYLYDGSLEYEKEYLKTYVNSPKAFLFTVFDGEQMVGATTCIPLADETEEVQKPFLDQGFDISSIFYFGESILLKEYRGIGLGNRFFEERETHAGSFPEIKTTCFCAVKRPDNHALKPTNYVPLDQFWKKRGYQKSDELVSYFDWKDIGDNESSEKPMEYWFKKI